MCYVEDIDICSRCYKWKVTSVLGFEWGVELGPIGLKIFAELEGDIEVEELPCSRAQGAEYCEFLDIFLPEDEKKDAKKIERCHSESPASVLFSYLALRFRLLKKEMGMEGDAKTAMQRRLDSIFRG